jgi:uncharacterized phage-associated protein
LLDKTVALTPPYPSVAVANWFIENLDDGVSPLKVQKLVYFAHGWHLALYNEPLIDEVVQAWEYGPVVPGIYRRFRRYGNQNIERLGMEYRIDDENVHAETPRVPNEDKRTIRLLRRIVEVYGDLTAGQLSTMTHQPDTPWYPIHQRNPNRKGVEIPDDEIKKYFRQIAGHRIDA